MLTAVLIGIGVLGVTENVNALYVNAPVLRHQEIPARQWMRRVYIGMIVKLLLAVSLLVLSHSYWPELAKGVTLSYIASVVLCLLMTLTRHCFERG